MYPLPSFSNVIVHLRSFSIDIRLLPTNYHHIALAPSSLDFHVEFQSQIIFRHDIYELAFDAQFRHICFHDDFYALFFYIFSGTIFKTCKNKIGSHLNLIYLIGHYT